MKFIDLTGKRINGWVVVGHEMLHTTAGGYQVHKWLFRCDCGAERISTATKIRNNKRPGCANCSMSTHGESRTRLNQIWRDMKLRGNGKYCSGNWYDGVTICDEWKEYEPFRDWALANGYNDTLTIDRIDNSKGYSPDNCRWATPLEQTLNRDATKLNEQAVIAMRYAHYVMGKQQKDIAKAYQIPKSRAGQAIRGDTWKHVINFN